MQSGPCSVPRLVRGSAWRWVRVDGNEGTATTGGGGQGVEMGHQPQSETNKHQVTQEHTYIQKSVKPHRKRAELKVYRATKDSTSPLGDVALPQLMDSRGTTDPLDWIYIHRSIGYITISQFVQLPNVVKIALSHLVWI